ncbi:MAG: deoxyguanosinetriphosphate triphosphohydrolase [Chloroflexi bacterium]|nr:deoxyguanosinetriphosphate triphosphohydrolase [Chloroflexota bacterium]MBM3172704.1 deoxyguanosinetriphosphate triphosphohydrolase [Chloroflexota bacterium]MBM3175486.1 deoxyguanosinetriphosphate triphosphohydrolase [Chloroflexota bacterium]MBM4450211.1 deoxyguanosinetriphosphate triphosphohydrolase [Chloroflexota bacterium]
MVVNLDIRQRIEEAEERLSPHASKNRYSRGRLKWEEPCQIRTDFQRDRDRIIHSNAFRRLKHKTQVFIAPLGDHYVTRLTHTLEVAQIARTISRALSLNEDLTETIALGHDLGHTPFGHIGEDILNELNPDGFRHNEQSLRIIDLLEKDGQGLNLTWEVRDGILKHSKGGIEVLGEGWNDVGTIEGQVVKIADIVAYVNHDIRDAIRANVITEDKLPKSVVKTLGHSSSERINTLVYDIVRQSLYTLNHSQASKSTISMSSNILEATNTLRDFLFEKVYNPSLNTEDTDSAKETIRFLYSHLKKHEGKMPKEYTLRNDSIGRKVTDYIAGMTDHYATRMAKEYSA